MRKYQICSNCVMDTSDPSIIFDNFGVCDHCNTFKKKILPGWDQEKEDGKIERLSEKIRESGKGKDFDCIIGLSGGIDSSYLAYIAVKKMGLRPLLFHVDAGWNSDIAVQNINCLVEGLNLDLYTEIINWEEMKDLQLSFFKSGVSHVDMPQDYAFFATMYKFASKYNIKYILTGANYSTECIRNPLEWMYYQSDTSQLNDIHNKNSTTNLKLKNFPKTSILWHKFWLPFVKGVKVVKPLNMINYIKKDAEKELINNFGFITYKQKHFESRFTRFYEGHWLLERFGYDVRRVQFSSLILNGQMSRNKAIELLKEKPLSEAEINVEYNFIANKLDINLNSLKNYFNMPKKSYRDYKNQLSLYKLGAKFLRKLGLELGGKR